MTTDSPDTMQEAFAVLRRILSAPGEPSAPRLSEALAPYLPHVVLAQLAGSCARSPMSVSGEPAIADLLTSSELAHVAAMVEVGEPWLGHARLGGRELSVAGFAADGPGGDGSLLVVGLVGDAIPSPSAMSFVQGLWELVAGWAARGVAEAAPTDLTASRVAAAERARVTGELSIAHSAALSALLGALRADSLDDAAARRAAIDIAAAALVELRAAPERERRLADEPVDVAFAVLQEELRPLVRFSSVRLELSGPTGDVRSIPSPAAQAARAIVRGAVLTMLEQDDLGRVRVDWQVDDALTVTVRDDGPGQLSDQVLAVHALADRARALDGTLELDSVPGWGTRVSARLPLGTVVDGRAGEPLDGLNPREIEVLQELARGRRNRQIAETLGISENTVKFHVTNVLGKLGASTRGEAAVMARDAGLGDAPLRSVG